MEELTKTYEEESVEYAILKEYFDKIDADLFRESEEEVIIRANQRREDFAKKIMHNAAAYIQKFARGRIAGAAVHKLKSKKGGKGKGKKKK